MIKRFLDQSNLLLSLKLNRQKKIEDSNIKIF